MSVPRSRFERVTYAVRKAHLRPLAGSFISGLGAALIAPAMNAFYLDISPEEHKSRILGIKDSAFSLGGVLGPLLVVIASGIIAPVSIFLLAGGLILTGALFVLLFLKEPAHAEAPKRTGWKISGQRCLAAQASLRGLVISSRAARSEA